MTPSITKMVPVGPSPSRAARLEWLVQRQAELADAWRRGKRCLVEDFVSQLKNDDERLTLLKAELEVRREIGDLPRYEEYLNRFPLLAPRLSQHFDNAITQVVRSPSHASLPSTARPVQTTVPGYEILEVLGRGGMGVVYKARQLGLNRHVALKMIIAGRFAGDDELARFRREGEAFAALDHPNIVRVYEVGEHEGTPFFSLEYVSGGTLAEALKKGPLAPADAALIAEAVARAAHEAHQHGIVHRDLKPANILLETRLKDETSTAPIGDNTRAKQTHLSTPAANIGVPKLTDFGIAKRLNETSALTATGIAAGTPQYMAPEQAIANKDHPVGAAADVYAIGVILYEMLTRRTPFEGDNPVEIMQRVVNHNPPAPSRFNAKISRDLETIILKCLEKNPLRRYPSALALAEELACWAEGKPIMARPVGKLVQGVRWCQRNRTVAGLLALTFFTLFTGSVVSTILAIDAHEQANIARKETQIAEDAELDARNSRALAEENAQEAKRNAAIADHNATTAQANEAKAKAAQDRNATLLQEATEGEQRRSRELYAADMNVAHSDWQSGHLQNVDYLLDKYTPTTTQPIDQRAFEWYYLQRLRKAYEGLIDLREPGEAVVRIPKTAQLAFVTRRGLSLYDMQQRGAFFSWQPSDTSLNLRTVAYAPQGEHLACLYYSNDVWIRKGSNFDVRHRLKVHKSAHYRATGATFSPDGKLLYVAVGSTTDVLGPGMVLVYDVESGKETKRYDGMKHSVNCLALSPDGQILSAGGHDGLLFQWKLETGELLRKVDVRSYIFSVAYAAEGNHLAMGTSKGEVLLYDTATMERRHTLSGHRDAVRQVAFADDGTSLASISDDALVRMWNTETGELRRVGRGHKENIRGIVFDPTSSARVVSIGADNIGLCWDIHRGGEGSFAFRSSVQIEALIRVPKSQHWLALNTVSGYHVLDLPNNRMENEIITPNFGGNAWHGAVSPDGQTMAVCVVHVGVYLFSLANPNVPPVELVKDRTLPCRVAYSPDGRWIIVGYHQGGLMAYPVDRSQPPISIGKQRRMIRSITFDSQRSDRFATTCADGTVRLWSLPEGEEILTIQEPDSYPMGLAFAPDGKTFAVARMDGVAVIRDTITGKVLRQFQGHTKKINSVGFSPDGTRLITGSDDLTVRLWDVQSTRTTLTFRSHERPVRDAQFSADGQKIISIAGNEVKLWDAAPGYAKEDGKQLVMNTYLRHAQATRDEKGMIHGTVKMVNTSGRPLRLPNPKSTGTKVLLLVNIQRLAADPTIPQLNSRKADEHDQYPIQTVKVPLEGDAFPTDGQHAIAFRFSTRDWPPGRYCVHLEHGWPTDTIHGNGRTSCIFTIPER